MRRGRLEPLCEDCWRARQRVADQLAGEETAAEGRKLFRRFQISPDQQRSARQARATATRKPPPAEKGKRERQRGNKPGRGGPRPISERLLAEVRHRHEQERQPLRQIARELLAQTGYANRPRRRDGAALPVQAARLAAAHPPLETLSLGRRPEQRREHGRCPGVLRWEPSAARDLAAGRFT